MHFGWKEKLLPPILSPSSICNPPDKAIGLAVVLVAISQLQITLAIFVELQLMLEIVYPSEGRHRSAHDINSNTNTIYICYVKKKHFTC